MATLAGRGPTVAVGMLMLLIAAVTFVWPLLQDLVH
jgi:hypothetical protein